MGNLMSPRGVAIPSLREQLFDAAERVLVRVGPSGLSVRSITREAGCATGVLHRHFADFDAFLVEFVLDRARAAAERAAAALEPGGRRTVVENLTEATLALGENGTRLIELWRSSGLEHRPRGTEPRSRGEAGGRFEIALVRYLEAEKRLGRVAPDVDAERMGFVLTATMHQLLARFARREDELAGETKRVLSALAVGLLPSGDGCVESAL